MLLVFLAFCLGGFGCSYQGCECMWTLCFSCWGMTLRKDLALVWMVYKNWKHTLSSVEQIGKWFFLPVPPFSYMLTSWPGYIWNLLPLAPIGKVVFYNRNFAFSDCHFIHWLKVFKCISALLQVTGSHYVMINSREY